MNKEHEDREKIKFADELITPVLNGTKEATVRYGGFESVQVGDTLIATTVDQARFAKLEIQKTASASAAEAHNLLQVFGASYPSTSSKDMIESLNQHYGKTITPDTTVQILVFDIRSRLNDN